MAEPSIELVETNAASVELSSDGYAYATVEAEFSNIPELGVAIEAQIILYKGDTIVSASDPSNSEVTSESPIFWLSDTFHSSTGQVPDSYCVCFRVFKPEESVSIMTPVPPEISRQSGSFLIHEPKKGFLSKEKWNTGLVTVESVIVKNAAGDDDELFINLFSKKPLDSGFRLQAESSGSSDETIFQLVDKPHMTSDYLRLHLIENINVTVTGFTASDWSMSDKKPLLVSENMTKRIEFNITGSGSEFQFHRLNQHEAVTLKEMFENGNAHDLTGWNWSNSICNGVYGVHVDDMVVLNEGLGNEVDLRDINLTEVQKISDLIDGFEQSDCLDVFYFAPSSVTGRFYIDLADSEEFEPSKLNINYLNYHLDGYPERYGKPISSIEYKGEEVSVEFEDTGGDSEFLCVGYEFEGDEFLDHIIIFENLFSPGSDPLAAEWNKLAGIFDKKESASIPNQKEAAKLKKDSSETIKKDIDKASSSSWFETKVTSESYLTEQFRMAITQFENDGPDDDGDVAVDFTIEIENESSKEIGLVKWDLIVDHNGAAIDGNVNNTEDCLLEKGDTFEVSSYLRLMQAYIEPAKPQLELKGYAKFYEREFLKLGEIEIPEALNEVVCKSAKVKSDFFENEITISLVRLPDSDESNVKEEEVYLKSSIANKSDFYIEDIEFKCVFIDRAGSEGDETYDYNNALAPNSGTFFQTSFYSVPKSKLKGAKVELFMKAYRLVGTKTFTDVKTLSL